MSLSFLSGEKDELNEHQIAWLTRDYDTIKKLSNEFKLPKEQSLFEIIENVTRKTGHKDVNIFSDYSQFAINSAISQHVPMMGYAYELNMMNGYITDQMHYDYLYHSVRKVSLPKVKFAKVTDDWVDRTFEKMIARYYEVNAQRAKTYIDDFSTDQLDILKRIVCVTVESADCELLKFIPLKADRIHTFNVIKNWQ